MKRSQRSDARWHRQPVVWLGALILAASLGGCLLLIALATTHADIPVATGRDVMAMPLARGADRPAAAERARP